MLLDLLSFINYLMSPSITDWLQAVAAIVGAIGVVWTLIDLKNNSIDQQKELNTLAKIADGLANQVKVATERRRLEIRPNLILNTKSYNGTYFGITVENTGGTATDISLFSPPDPYDGYLEEIDFSFKDGSSVIYPQSKQVIQVNVRGISSVEILDLFKFSIYYTDHDGNEYVQQVVGMGGQLHYTLPSYLGHISEWGDSQYERSNKYERVYYQIYDIPKASMVF
ncbi:hypothetical protein [Pontibacter ruber]|uniref:Uncharacterized protein n=1 Tax=Pontibacter ruber TaxID=1343895 RepID=A0ABW5CXW1_9BACT|nr:hypothetical protein [Pontibacter ruber]